jgi:hypothetical protein
MALLPSELARCKFELGYNALSLSALPYAIDGITQMFEQIVAPYLQAGALAFSSTVVVAATAATPVVLTLSSGTGFTVGSVVIVDQGDTQESSYVQVIAGTSLTVPLLNAHSGTYPVTVEGGESIVRDILRECRALGGPGGSISLAASSAGIKIADKGDVEFFPNSSNGGGEIATLLELQRYWRNELATALGVENLRESRAGAGQVLVSY